MAGDPSFPSAIVAPLLFHSNHFIIIIYTWWIEFNQQHQWNLAGLPDILIMSNKLNKWRRLKLSNGWFKLSIHLLCQLQATSHCMLTSFPRHLQYTHEWMKLETNSSYLVPALTTWETKITCNGRKAQENWAMGPCWLWPALSSQLMGRYWLNL